jgi:hypothetical protein
MVPAPVSGLDLLAQPTTLLLLLLLLLPLHPQASACGNAATHPPKAAWRW